MMNGDNRKNMLTIMSMLVISIFAGGGYLFYFAIDIGNDQLANELYNLLSTLATLIIGLFVAIGRELFNVGKNKPVILQRNPDGTTSYMGGGD